MLTEFLRTKKSPSGGIALDVACGLGENSLFLARSGFSVLAWDISDVAISALRERASRDNLDITATALDITPAELPRSAFDLVNVCHFLDRSLIPAIRDSIKPGGLLCYQTFTIDKTLQIGPSNPEFLLETGELKLFVPAWDILTYRDESLNEDPNHPLSGRACIIARKPVAPN